MVVILIVFFCCIKKCHKMNFKRGGSYIDSSG